MQFFVGKMRSIRYFLKLGIVIDHNSTSSAKFRQCEIIFICGKSFENLRVSKMSGNKLMQKVVTPQDIKL